MQPPALPYSGEIARKALHLLAMLMPAGMLFVPRPEALVILWTLAILAMATDLWRQHNPTLGSWIDRRLGFMMRASERGLHPDRRFNGATWVMITAALLLTVFPAKFAAPGMVIAMIADAGAALVGRKIGRHPWPGTSRTVEGSAGFLLTGVLAALLFPGIPWSHRLAAIGVAAVVEIPPIRVNDNLLLPFAASTVLWWLAGAPPIW